MRPQPMPFNVPATPPVLPDNLISCSVFGLSRPTTLQFTPEQLSRPAFVLAKQEKYAAQGAILRVKGYADVLPATQQEVKNAVIVRGMGHRNAVRHIDSGRIFTSIEKAARVMRTSHTTVRKCINEGHTYELVAKC